LHTSCCRLTFSCSIYQKIILVCASISGDGQGSSTKKPAPLLSARSRLPGGGSNARFAVIERRQAIRYYLRGIAQVVDLDSHAELISITRDLSLSGCFVKINTPFPQGTHVRVNITLWGKDFV